MRERDTRTAEAGFHVGQLIHHKLFGYRGVVIDVDSHFLGTEEWYRDVARSRPPKDRPWYHVLVDGAEQQTYVAERNLEPDEEGGPVDHPEVAMHFKAMGADGYVPHHKHN